MLLIEKAVSENKGELQGIKSLFVVVTAVSPAYLIGLAH